MALATNHRGGPHLTPAYKNISAVPMGQRIYLVGRGGMREIVMGSSLFLDYLQSLGGEHSFSALISITVNASLVIVSARLLLRTTAAGLFSPPHIKIYPPSLWDNGYIWWAGVECERLSWGFSLSRLSPISRRRA